MIFLLVAGIGILVAGLVAIFLGIPVKEFSFGNTLILSGSVAACTGTLILALYVAVRELKAAARLGAAPGEALPRTESIPRSSQGEAPGDQAESGFLFERDRHARGGAETTALSLPGGGTPPWHEETTGRHRGALPAADAAAADELAARPRRNLLFSSSSRKERERGEPRSLDPAEAGPESAGNPDTPPVPTFEQAWPQPERSRPEPASRRSRPPPTFRTPDELPAAAELTPSGPRDEDPSSITVLKSGVVDGMAYSLYSDGSIEAQMPEGMMRFGSIEELRSHLDQRP